MQQSANTTAAFPGLEHTAQPESAYSAPASYRIIETSNIARYLNPDLNLPHYHRTSFNTKHSQNKLPHSATNFTLSNPVAILNSLPLPPSLPSALSLPSS